jgi:hypothetical protein
MASMSEGLSVIACGQRLACPAIGLEKKSKSIFKFRTKTCGSPECTYRSWRIRLISEISSQGELALGVKEFQHDIRRQRIVLFGENSINFKKFGTKFTGKNFEIQVDRDVGIESSWTLSKKILG